MSQIAPTNRIFTEENIIRKTEAVSPKITITWEPGTTNGTIEYQVMDLVTENDVVKGMVPHTRLRGKTGAALVTLTLAKVLASTIQVELPDGTFYPIPGNLVVGAVKAVFDKEFNEQLQAQMEADALAAETPTAPVTPAPVLDPATTA